MGGASDIQVGGWIDRHVPDSIRPYLRLARIDRPIGTWLLLFPCWWSVALAAMPVGYLHLDDIGLYLLFAVGAVVMRGAGCTLNDIVDRDLDAKVARTAMRPLPSGAISLRQALLFLALQLLCGFSVLLTLNKTALWLGIASLGLVVLYPFMKRITWWPQAFLGLTFNWGALMGWAAVRDMLGWPPFFLYLAGIAWTLVYDTIYAYQDVADDRIVGIRSTARRFGDEPRPWLVAFAFLMLIFLCISLSMTGVGAIAYLGVVGTGLHLLWQIVFFDPGNPKDCLAKFRANRWIGWIVLAGLVLSPLFS